MLLLLTGLHSIVTSHIVERVYENVSYCYLRCQTWCGHSQVRMLLAQLNIEPQPSHSIQSPSRSEGQWAAGVEVLFFCRSPVLGKEWVLQVKACNNLPSTQKCSSCRAAELLVQERNSTSRCIRRYGGRTRFKSPQKKRSKEGLGMK